MVLIVVRKWGASVRVAGGMLPVGCDEASSEPCNMLICVNVAEVCDATGLIVVTQLTPSLLTFLYSQSAK